mmetsp:Transcript_9006/g.14586  ORF Transcript_9006/g.14586 Transcript_9006/m.14586 type:complete len:296 (+) Transcript_9006:487-1374(+)
MPTPAKGQENDGHGVTQHLLRPKDLAATEHPTSPPGQHRAAGQSSERGGGAQGPPRAPFLSAKPGFFSVARNVIQQSPRNSPPPPPPPRSGRLGSPGREPSARALCSSGSEAPSSVSAPSAKAAAGASAAHSRRSSPARQGAPTASCPGATAVAPMRPSATPPPPPSAAADASSEETCKTSDETWDGSSRTRGGRARGGARAGTAADGRCSLGGGGVVSPSMYSPGHPCTDSAGRRLVPSRACAAAMPCPSSPVPRTISFTPCRPPWKLGGILTPSGNKGGGWFTKRVGRMVGTS